jgi:two-component system response regulator
VANGGCAETDTLVLVIEDNDADAALIQRALARATPSEHVCRVSDGNAALALLENWNGEPVQLVLLDLHLSTRSGLEVLEQLRKAPRTRHVPVVVMSGSSDRDDVARSYDLGANSYISKTDRGEQFEHTIGHLLSYWLELNQAYVPPGAKR